MHSYRLSLLTFFLFSTLSQAQSDLVKTSDIPIFNGETYESVLVNQYLKKHPKIQEIADISSLHVINDNYAVDQKNAYYGHKIMIGADLTTLTSYKFSSTYNNYAMDHNNVYLKGDKLPLANPLQFNDLGYSSRNRYSMDDHYVYFNNEIIRDADPNSFVLGTNGHAQDHQYVYYGANKLNNSNAKTFRFLNDEQSGYAADINQVYYFPNILKGSDPQTFQMFNEYIAKDAHAFYFRAQKFDGVKDLKTLQILHSYYPDLNIMKDQYHVYYSRYDDFYMISDADVDTFQVIPAHYDEYARDKNHVYNLTSDGYRIFDKLNPQTTKIQGPFLLDGKHLYNKLSSWQETISNDTKIPLEGYELIEFIDLPSFEYLGGPYAMDKDIVFMGLGHTLTVLGKRAELQPKIIRSQKSPRYLIKIGEECFNINMSKYTCPSH